MLVVRCCVHHEHRNSERAQVHTCRKCPRLSREEFQQKNEQSGVAGEQGTPQHDTHTDQLPHGSCEEAEDGHARGYTHRNPENRPSAVSVEQESGEYLHGATDVDGRSGKGTEVFVFACQIELGDV